jgi:hypothetical protein
MLNALKQSSNDSRSGSDIESLWIPGHQATPHLKIDLLQDVPFGNGCGLGI